MESRAAIYFDLVWSRIHASSSLLNDILASVELTSLSELTWFHARNERHLARARTHVERAYHRQRSNIVESIYESWYRVKGDLLTMYRSQKTSQNIRPEHNVKCYSILHITRNVNISVKIKESKYTSQHDILLSDSRVLTWKLKFRNLKIYLTHRCFL